MAIYYRVMIVVQLRSSTSLMVKILGKMSPQLMDNSWSTTNKVHQRRTFSALVPKHKGVRFSSSPPQKTAQPQRFCGFFIFFGQILGKSDLKWSRVQVSLSIVHLWTEQSQKPHKIGTFPFRAFKLSVRKNTKSTYKSTYFRAKEKPHRLCDGVILFEEVYMTEVYAFLSLDLSSGSSIAAINSGRDLSISDRTFDDRSFLLRLISFLILAFSS